MIYYNIYNKQHSRCLYFYLYSKAIPLLQFLLFASMVLCVVFVLSVFLISPSFVTREGGTS